MICQYLSLRFSPLYNIYTLTSLQRTQGDIYGTIPLSSQQSCEVDWIKGRRVAQDHPESFVRTEIVNMVTTPLSLPAFLLIAEA